MSTLDDIIIWFTELVISLNMDDMQIFKNEISAALILVIIIVTITGIFMRKRKVKPNTDPNVAETKDGPKEGTHNLSLSIVVSIILLVIVAACIALNRGRIPDGEGQASVPENTEVQSSLTSDSTLLMNNINDICDQIEKSFSALGFEKGSITTETDTFDTSTMSAEIQDMHIGNTAYLWQDINSRKYTALFIPIHFSLHINQTLTFEEQTIDDIVGYAWIKLSEVGEQGNLRYEVYNYLTAQYFMSEELLYKHLCGNGYAVEKIELNR